MMHVRARALMIAALCALLMAGCAQTGGGAGAASSASASQSSTSVLNSTSNLPSNDSSERKRARIRLELAYNYYRERQIKTALDEIRQALNIDANFPDAYSLRGLILFDIGEMRDAETDFRKALQLSSQDPDINNSFGWFLCQTNRVSEAMPYFNTAARNPLYQTPDKPLQNAGICAMRVKDWKAAENFLMKSHELEPGNVLGVYNLGLLYLRSGDYERAWFYADKLNKMTKPSAESLWLAIRVAHKRNDQPVKESMATQLRRGFIASREWAAYQRGAFDE
jgi:type IV pilus assembly protein PilF